MSDRTTEPGQFRASQVTPESLHLQCIDLSRRLHQIERTVTAIGKSNSMLVDAEVARLTADFTPEQLAEVNEAMRLEWDRIVAEIRAETLAER